MSVAITLALTLPRHTAETLACCLGGTGIVPEDLLPPDVADAFLGTLLTLPAHTRRKVAADLYELTDPSPGGHASPNRN